MNVSIYEEFARRRRRQQDVLSSLRALGIVAPQNEFAPELNPAYEPRIFSEPPLSDVRGVQGFYADPMTTFNPGAQPIVVFRADPTHSRRGMQTFGHELAHGVQAVHSKGPAAQAYRDYVDILRDSYGMAGRSTDNAYSLHANNQYLNPLASRRGQVIQEYAAEQFPWSTYSASRYPEFYSDWANQLSPDIFAEASGGYALQNPGRPEFPTYMENVPMSYVQSPSIALDAFINSDVDPNTARGVDIDVPTSKAISIAKLWQGLLGSALKQRSDAMRE